MLKSFEISRFRMSADRIVLLVAMYFTLVLNVRFFTNVLHEYPIGSSSPVFLLSLALLLFALNVFLLSLIGFDRLLKPALIVLLPLTAVSAGFMDSYNVILDADMLRNALMTDSREVVDLIGFRLVLYVLWLGVLPLVLLRFVDIETSRSWKRQALMRAGMSIASLSVVILLVLMSRSEFTFFFREHKALREYANPAFPLYSFGKLVTDRFDGGGGPITTLGEDARVPDWDTERELIILVVGETVRADRLSINGYRRETTPVLQARNAYSFTNAWSCGTSTGVSVPCMFSRRPEHGFDPDTITHEENLLDVLAHADVNLLWRDNNSSSKGVADRVAYEDWRSSDINPVCDIECRDVGMLSGLQDYIDSRESGDIVIILHQMGNHGPAYYKRYPKDFEQFTPVCETNQLSDCPREYIDNAYDNAVLYTDHFLGKVIDLLAANDSRFESVMMYVSDHGESLGEEGLYLHGLPYDFSPEEQRHVPVLFWFGDHYHDVDRAALEKQLDRRYTHGNIFDTVLGLLEIESSLYHPDEDMLPHISHQHDIDSAHRKQAQ